MKKVIFAIVALATLTLVSCEKNPIGGTAVESMAGQWYVQVDGYDSKGDSVVVPCFNLKEGYTKTEHFLLLTYNNSNNDPNKLYISDMGGFWDFTVLTDCNVNNLTFGSTDSIENEASRYGFLVALTNGKIVKNGTTTPSGAKADYIEFFINFEDDDLGYIFGIPAYDGVSWGQYYAGYGMKFDVFRVSGWRYTGLANDED